MCFCFLWGFLPFSFLETVSSSEPPRIRPPPCGLRGSGQPGEAGARRDSPLRAPAGRVFAYLRGSESGRRKFAYVNTDRHGPSRERQTHGHADAHENKTGSGGRGVHPV